MINSNDQTDEVRSSSYFFFFLELVTVNNNDGVIEEKKNVSDKSSTAGYGKDDVNIKQTCRQRQHEPVCNISAKVTDNDVKITKKS